jgi:cephalosporin-C deacetylase-like acetyl esterase
MDTPESQFAAMNSLQQEKKIHLLSAETTFNVEQQKPCATCWKNE